VEGAPAFRWTDFLAGTELDAADWEGVGFIFLSVFRVIVCLPFRRLFRSATPWFNQSSPWSRDRFHDKVLSFVSPEHHHHFLKRSVVSIADPRNSTMQSHVILTSVCIYGVPWTRCIPDIVVCSGKAKKKLWIIFRSTQTFRTGLYLLSPEVRKRAPSRKEAAFEKVRGILSGQQARALASATPGSR
jgi:hypothetical protein